MLSGLFSNLDLLFAYFKPQHYPPHHSTCHIHHGSFIHYNNQTSYFESFSHTHTTIYIFKVSFIPKANKQHIILSFILLFTVI